MSAELMTRKTTLSLRNDEVELVLDRRDGQVREIRNRRLGWNFKTSPGGAWPISYWIRHPVYPWLGGSPRQMVASAEEYVSLRSIRDSATREGMALELRYDEIGVVRRLDARDYPGVLEGKARPDVVADRDMARISARVEIRLPHDADYFMFRTTLDLRKSRCEIVRLGSGWGGALRADPSHKHERLAVPEWYGGAIYDDPRKAAAGRASAGQNMLWPYVGGSPNSLLAGWIDLYGRRGGLGIGYLGRSGQTVVFEAAEDGKGLSLGWRTFDLSGVHTYFGDHADGLAGVYPLAAGSVYTGDWWIVAPHRGDWHRMADIYRDEFRKAMPEEHVEARSISPAAREADFILPCTLPHRAGGRKFDGLPRAVRAVTRALGARPEQALVWLIGTQEEGFDTTFARRALRELGEMGLGGALLYTNPSYNHPLARRYVPRADTGIRANHGNFACFASPAWRKMWLDEIAPDLLKLGVCGIQIDQWPLAFCLCRRSGHGHATDSVSVLRGQALGKRRWLKAMRDALRRREPRWFFFSESGTDLVGALADIWTFGLNAAYPDGHPRPEIARFTHPQYVMTSGMSILDELVNGFLTCAAGVDQEGDGAARARGLAARKDFAEYRRVRNELRAAGAPGFPHGFRDTLGLVVRSRDLVARSYSDERGATVVFYALRPVRTKVRVVPEILGLAGRKPETFDVSLKAGRASWWRTDGASPADA
jgi:hypothetical protein